MTLITHGYKQCSPLLLCRINTIVIYIHWTYRNSTTFRSKSIANCFDLISNRACNDWLIEFFNDPRFIQLCVAKLISIVALLCQVHWSILQYFRNPVINFLLQLWYTDNIHVPTVRNGNNLWCLIISLRILFGCCVNFYLHLLKCGYFKFVFTFRFKFCLLVT